MKKIFAGLSVFLFAISVFAQESTRSLTSEKWQFKNAEKTDWMPAEVPGTVHTDLMDNAVIPDPFVDRNESRVQWNENVDRKVRWVENEDWDYQTTFTISADELENQNVELVFDGLDTFAEVYLNGENILSADNMFRQWRVAVKKSLKEGDNKLQIKFKSSVKVGDKLADKVPFMTPESPRAFVRKAQYQFGWDWGPRLVTAGIWKDVRLHFWNEAELKNIKLAQTKLNDNKGKLNFHMNIRAQNPGKYLVKVNDKSKKVKLKKGDNKISIPYTVKAPKLWQPSGWGEPHLYDFTIKLIKDGEKLSEDKVRHGFRTVELVREKDKSGESFYFKVNGHPLYAKGANWIPNDNFLPRLTKEDYRNMIENAKAANMNMIRIWGGGVYENDEFYKAADENGILIWQDFMFAGTFYPSDKEFLNNVREEVKYQVNRLQNHPSIVLWSGNNEVREAISGWGYQKKLNYTTEDSLQVWEDYHKIFEEVIPNTLDKTLADDDYVYLASSPTGHAESRAAASDGDSHYWGVWHNYEPFEAFNDNVGRFVSEFGFQGMPTLETIKAMFSEDVDLDELSIFNKTVLFHEKDDGGWGKMFKIMDREYQIPKSFIQYDYVSQLLQARAIKVGLETFRRNKPYNMGSLVWQLNDTWPVTSWSAIDYLGNWKALQYQIKRSYRPQILLSHEKEGQLNIFAVNDALENFKNPKLEIQLINFQGDILKTIAKDYKGKTLEGELKLGSFEKAKLIGDVEENKVFLKLTLKNKAQGRITANTYFFGKPKDLELEKPDIQIKKISAEEIEISTDVLAKDVYLMGPIHYSDNFFDLLPGETKRIKLSSPVEKIEIMTLWDTMN